MHAELLQLIIFVLMFTVTFAFAINIPAIVKK